jgi:hypothetical protein
MKKISTLLLIACFSIQLTAQTTIISSDMPSPNDSIRMSKALNPSMFNFAQTGTNYNWDFSQLTAVSQRTDKYMSVSSTPLIYNVVFFSKSNLASRRDDMNLLTIQITDGYNFLKNSSSDFRQVGYGASVNGSTIPVTFKSDDIIYRFPIAIGNVDSCDSEWDVNVPGIGYIGEKKHRVNTVDGWGSITTPYGTFQCVRLRSEIIQEDTVFYTSTSMGFTLPQTYTEYIWLSKTLPFPILKASVPNLGTAATVEYIDSNRQFVGIPQAKAEIINLEVYPNPSYSGFSLTINTTSNETSNLKISDFQGRIIYQELFHKNYEKHFSKDFLSAGAYLINVTSKNNSITKKIIIQ